ncbi:MAG TPA: DUF6659 family protein [Nitrososphaeraceae archaeon]
MDFGLCDRIISLDDNIRFVGIVNKLGEVIAGGFQKGVEPLLEEEDEQELYVHSLSNMAILNNFSDRLGKVCYHIAKHDKVSLMTFPLPDGILCLSMSSRADIDKIRNSILNMIKNDGSHKN